MVAVVQMRLARLNVLSVLLALFTNTLSQAAA